MSTIPRDFNPGISFPAYLLRKRLLGAITALAPELKGKLLDFGCGSKPYRSLFTVDEYIGVDFENPGHSHENEEIDVYYDGHKLPFADNSFDSVFSSEVFEHIFNLEEIMGEIRRVLKPGGKILVTCPFAIVEHETPNDFARYSSFGLKHIFEKNGFSVLKFEKSGSHIETLYQLRIMYIHLHIAPVFRKIPIVRSVFRVFTYTLYNIVALACNKIFPKRNDLYMNNVILCVKN